MDVLVTGAAGFIGSRLLRRLLDQGHRVCGIDDFSLGTRDNLAEIANHPNLRIVEMDVRAPTLHSVMAETKPERVFHLAANSDISKGTSDTTTDLHRTFETTYHVLEAMRRVGSRELFFASTSAIYGEAPGQLKEDHGPLEPISLYGAAKLASEAYVSAYCNLFDMRASVFRFPNVVGPNLTHGAIYDFVRRLLADKTRLKVLGNGSQTKPYLHVDDLIDAILLAVDHRSSERVAVYNVAGEGLTSVREIAELVRAKSGFPSAALEFGTEDRGWPGDVPRFEYDTRKIRSLGWKPRLSSHEAVAASIEAEVEKCRRSS